MFDGERERERERVTNSSYIYSRGHEKIAITVITVNGW